MRPVPLLISDYDTDFKVSITPFPPVIAKSMPQNERLIRARDLPSASVATPVLPYFLIGHLVLIDATKTPEMQHLTAQAHFMRAS